jgi:hypothetical protein
MPDFGIFRGFNDKLFGNKLYAGQLPTQLGMIGSEFFGIDPDAQAFFDRVTTAGGTLSGIEKTAIDTLVKQMKTDNIWTKMKSIYPMVGASAAACAQNLKSSSFTGTFNGGWTFASTGVTPNGSTGYFNTSLIPNTNLTLNSASWSVYSRNNFTPSNTQSIGCSNSVNFLPLVATSFLTNKSLESSIYSYNNPDVLKSATSQNFAGLFTTTRTASSNAKLFRNNTQLAAVTTQGQTSQPTNSFTFGAFRSFTGFQDYNTFEMAFAHIGDGLTDTESFNFYTAIQAFQTTLSRQV